MELITTTNTAMIFTSSILLLRRLHTLTHDLSLFFHLTIFTQLIAVTNTQLTLNNYKFSFSLTNLFINQPIQPESCLQGKLLGIAA